MDTLRTYNFIIDSPEDTILISFQLPDAVPIHVQSIDKQTSQEACFGTFSCDNINLIEDVKHVKSFNNVINTREFLLLLDLLGYV